MHRETFEADQNELGFAAKSGSRYEVTIAQLAKEIMALNVAGNLRAEARDVTHDSRSCREGSVFVAIRGEKFDAHRFIPEVVEKGAVAIISEREASEFSAPAWIEVADARRALALAAAAIHRHPSRRLKLVGVTGTNGKTTTAHLIDSIIRASEGMSAMMGTISYRIGNEVVTAHHTTPEATDIQRMLARALDAGCHSAVMEVSSHAIELHRADGLQFAAAVFTNLTRDHLDYHKTMDSYFNAKKRLFDGSLGCAPRISIINIDDEWGRRLASEIECEKITYGLSENAGVRTSQFDQTARGLTFVATTPAGQIEILAQLVGRPHVYNSLAALATGLALGVDLETAARGISECPGVAGRFEQVRTETDPGFMVVVDYAHTDDALRNVLQTAREVARAGRVITVFG
ncbi:MAG: UDP-N-acetylmuramoyl-L-alanyl-D-glutamate--2,6-diaminopimelate ligase, partial [Acidobacteriota bacterium]